MQCFGPKGSQQPGKTGTYRNMIKEHICPMFYMCLPVQSGYTAFSEILVSILMGTLALDFPLFP